MSVVDHLRLSATIDRCYAASNILNVRLLLSHMKYLFREMPSNAGRGDVNNKRGSDKRGADDANHDDKKSNKRRKIYDEDEDVSSFQGKEATRARGSQQKSSESSSSSSEPKPGQEKQEARASSADAPAAKECQKSRNDLGISLTDRIDKL
jgi:hypothetical protein